MLVWHEEIKDGYIWYHCISSCYRHPLTRCPGTVVTVKADLDWDNLNFCRTQDFPADKYCLLIHNQYHSKQHRQTIWTKIQDFILNKIIVCTNSHHQTALCSPSWKWWEYPRLISTCAHLKVVTVVVRTSIVLKLPWYKVLISCAQPFYPQCCRTFRI